MENRKKNVSTHFCPRGRPGREGAGEVWVKYRGGRDVAPKPGGDTDRGDWSLVFAMD
jgi:hypothetical protein